MENAIGSAIPLEPGIYPDISLDEYNSHPAIRSSHLKILLDEMPADMKVKMDLDKSESQSRKACLLNGEVLHAMVLEPMTQEHRFVYEKEPLKEKNKLEENGGSKKAWDALKATAKQYGRTLVPYEIYRGCQGMSEPLMKNTRWTNVQRFGSKELTLIADIKGVRCKVRLDAMLKPISLPGTIVDLKTTSKGLSDRQIEKTIVEYGYQFSAAMYIEVAKALGISIGAFEWVFLQSEAPHQHRFFAANEDMLERGKWEFYKTLEIYRLAAETGNWPGYPTQTVTKVGLPSWYMKKQYPFGSFE